MEKPRGSDRATFDGHSSPSGFHSEVAFDGGSAARGQDAPDAEIDAIRRQMEDSLRQIDFDRGLWRTTVDSMLDFVVLADAAGRPLYMNPAYTRVLGQSLSPDVPVEGQAAHYRLYHADGTLYESLDLPLQRAVLRDEEVRGAEVVHVTPAGEKLFTVWNASPLYSRDGSISGAVAVGRDVSEQRRWDESRARLAAIVSTSEDAIIGKDLDGIVTSWNRGAERLYGYDASEMVGRPISTIIPREAEHEFGEIMKQLRNGQRVNTYETVRRAKDGRMVRVSITVSPVLDSSGKVIGAATIARDVTARKRAEEGQRFMADVSASLSRSLDYRDTLHRVASLAVPALGDVCIVDAIENRRIGERATQGVRAAADKARRIDMSYALDSDPSHPVWDVLRTGRARVLDLAPNGVTERPPTVTSLVEAGARSCLIVPIIIRERPAGAISLISLVEDRKWDSDAMRLAEEFAARAATALDNARLFRDAQEAVRARDQFLSIAAHELKTPMTSLRGFVQLAMRQMERDGALDPAQARQALLVIDQQSRKLSGLISQLLDVSRLEAGRLSLERRVVDLSGLVERTVAAAALANSEHTIESRLCPEVLALVDPLRIQQVVNGLIDNAAKFSPLGTQIEVTLTHLSSERVQFTVRDHGSGIPMEQRDRLFTRFYHGQPNEQGGGIGLGLYISREIVLLHGGSIEAVFPEDGGSRFVVTLPTGVPESGSAA
ncbi:MAG TPA: PAS domain S-box protein [Chloroflexota bacterium]